MAALQKAVGVVAVDLDLFHLKGFNTLTPAERRCARPLPNRCKGMSASIRPGQRRRTRR